jgi:hypothetical protein
VRDDIQHIFIHKVNDTYHGFFEPVADRVSDLSDLGRILGDDDSIETLMDVVYYVSYRYGLQFGNNFTIIVFLLGIICQKELIIVSILESTYVCKVLLMEGNHSGGLYRDF